MNADNPTIDAMNSADDTTQLASSADDIVAKVAELSPAGKPGVLQFLAEIADKHSLYMRGEVLGEDGYTPVKFPKLMASGTQASRVILSSKKHANYKSQIWFDCNGLVFDAATWKPLVVPPSTLNHLPNLKEVDGYLRRGLYDTIPVLDGTLMTFYYWEDSWCISTANGYDVSSLRWIGDKTFADVAFEALSQYPDFVESSGMTMVKDRLAFGELEGAGASGVKRGVDKSATYSMIVRHHDYHPLKSDPMGVWTVKIPPDTPFDKLPKQTVIMEKYADLADIRRRMAKSVKNFLESGEINYGYILRGTSDMGESYHVLVPSKLYLTIKSMVYSKAPKEIRNKITHETRSEFISLRAFLNRGKTLFTAIFPVLAERFAKYEEYIDNVANMVVRFNSQMKIGKARIERPDSPVGIIAYGLFKYIQDSNLDINPFRSDAKSIVLSAITQPQHAYLYLKAMTLERAAE